MTYIYQESTTTIGEHWGGLGGQPPSVEQNSSPPSESQKHPSPKIRYSDPPLRKLTLYEAKHESKSLGQKFLRLRRAPLCKRRTICSSSVCPHCRHFCTLKHITSPSAQKFICNDFLRGKWRNMYRPPQNPGPPLEFLALLNRPPQ